MSCKADDFAVDGGAVERLGVNNVWGFNANQNVSGDDVVLAEDYLRRHEGTGLSSTTWAMSEQQLETLVTALNRPRRLVLSGPAVTENVLRKIGGNSESLTGLGIWGGDFSKWYERPSEFSGEGLANLQFRSLEEFRFGFLYLEDYPSAQTGDGSLNTLTYSTRSQLSDSAMAALSTAPKLKFVVLVDCLLRDRSLRHLSDSRELTTLRLDGNPIAGDGLLHLTACKRLKHLSLGSCSLTDEGLQQLPSLPALEVLNLYNNQIGDAGLAHLTKARFPKLNCLILSRTDVTAEGLAGLADFEGQLHIGELRLSDNDLKFLEQSPGIVTVTLFRNKLTDNSAERLAKLKHLKWLDVRQTGITEEGVQAIKAALPDCVVGPCGPVLQYRVYSGGRDHFPGMDVIPEP
ncbi:MAG: leucine-rich repeat domain-containing protein [Planctomycetaceae bacterium]|nr:leucine-rich repeat domain-containing protein [Planctomycetaceae bacterium]MCB9949612.1 leucine-rich repeat domain-containing protein [Planctomycetaceae bacterium]